MAPLLKPGDQVFVQAAVMDTIKRGDLLLMRRKDGFLVHRLVAVDTWGWHTKGDRNRLADAPVSAPAVVGLVTAFERNGDRYSVLTRRHLIFASVLGWLGRKEMASQKRIGAWLTHSASRLLQTVCYR
jgi:hypothetical protein